MKFHRSVKVFKAVIHQFWNKTWSVDMLRGGQGNTLPLWPILSQRQSWAWIRLDLDAGRRAARSLHSKYQE